MSKSSSSEKKPLKFKSVDWSLERFKKKEGKKPQNLKDMLAKHKKGTKEV